MRTAPKKHSDYSLDIFNNFIFKKNNKNNKKNYLVMKIFIIGCGRILQKHLDSIKILKKIKIVGIADINKDRLNKIFKKDKC